MAESVMGVETEYMFSAFYHGGMRVEQSDAMGMLFHTAERVLRHLPGAGVGGLFLENASRFYIDCGGHPEIAGPEVTTPWDVVRFQLGADCIMLRLAENLVRENPTIQAANVYRNNIGYDPSVSQATWGCHESYMHSFNPDDLPKELVSHLASRVIFTGGGGFNNLSVGAEFFLSPRVPHLCHVISFHSTNSRGIYHTKDEPLARSGHRLHLYCGESLHSQEAAVLRHGTTALVLAMTSAGRRPAEGIRLRAPLEAMRTFAADPSCTALVETENGRLVRALDVQRHYLEQAEMAVGEPFMPSWAGHICEMWRNILDQIEQGGPEAIAAKVDWAMKYAIYASLLKMEGWTWDTLRAWSKIAQQLGGALQHIPPDQPTSAGVQRLLATDSQAAARIRRLTPSLHRQGLDWDGLGQFLNLRLKFFEVDTRFGQLGEDGLFSSMDRDGILDHRMPEISHIEAAATEPPETTRAALRGKWIKELVTVGNSSADWTGVYNGSTQKWLDLSDPLCTSETWKTNDDRLGFMAAQLGIPPVPESFRRREERQPAPDETLGRFHIGDRVVLGRHEPVGGSENWNSDMEQYVGRTATVLRIVGLDSSGCEVVRVDIDQGRYVWRARNLTHAHEDVA
ncbi:MAG: proteasome accessory factor PafA2 family protein [Candidatus Hydrogenedentes bacterium]|nr:proteasome accessory factor PafA2 family protein [Candidatus Hydrogenedentota bacterium]